MTQIKNLENGNQKGKVTIVEVEKNGKTEIDIDRESKIVFKCNQCSHRFSPIVVKPGDWVVLVYDRALDRIVPIVTDSEHYLQAKMSYFKTRKKINITKKEMVIIGSITVIVAIIVSILLPSIINSFTYQCRFCEGGIAIKARGTVKGNVSIPLKMWFRPVIRLDDGAFADSFGLTSVTIPNSVTSIGKMAFSGCWGLTSIEIPNGVTSIGEMAFDGCAGLTSVTIPNSVTSIGNYAFSNCFKLKSMTIPNSITSIGHYTFNDCHSLTSIEIPNSVTNIGGYAFEGCRSLTSVEIPNSITNIEIYAFSGCDALTSITIPNSVTNIGEYAFYKCNIKEIHFTGNIKDWCTIHRGQNSLSPSYDLYIGDNLVTNLEIPTSFTNIGNEAFEGCTSLTSITFPDGITEIGPNTFRGCTNLKKLNIPESVVEINHGAFQGCTNLKSVTIQGINPHIGDSAFQGCTNLEHVKINCEESVRSVSTSFADCPLLLRNSKLNELNDWINWLILQRFGYIGSRSDVTYGSADFYCGRDENKFYIEGSFYTIISYDILSSTKIRMEVVDDEMLRNVGAYLVYPVVVDCEEGELTIRIHGRSFVYHNY